jgi:hypothetical protein
LQNLQPISTESIKNRKRDEKILLRKDPVTNQAKSARIPTLLYGFPTFMSIPEIRFYPRQSSIMAIMAILAIMAIVNL